MRFLHSYLIYIYAIYTYSTLLNSLEYMCINIDIYIYKYHISLNSLEHFMWCISDQFSNFTNSTHFFWFKSKWPIIMAKVRPKTIINWQVRCASSPWQPTELSDAKMVLLSPAWVALFVQGIPLLFTPFLGEKKVMIHPI